MKWENPLISDMTMAQDLAEWIADYYSAGIEYEYTTRGKMKGLLPATLTISP